MIKKIGSLFCFTVFYIIWGYEQKNIRVFPFYLSVAFFFFILYGSYTGKSCYCLKFFQG